MLKPRRANMLEMRMSAPGLFSTSTDSVCLTPRDRLLVADLVRVLDEVECGGARRDHREAVLARVDPRVDDGRPAARERLLERALELVLAVRR